MSVEATRQSNGDWGIYTDNGREKTQYEVSEWVSKAVKLGAGEIMLTSVDREGTGKGFDLELIELVANSVNVPIIASGGMGNTNHAFDAIKVGADAIAMADILHYDKMTMKEILKKRRCLSHRRYVEHRMAELTNEILEDALATGKVNLEKRKQLLKYKEHLKYL